MLQTNTSPFRSTGELPSEPPVMLTCGPYAEELPIGHLAVGEIRARYGKRLDIHPACSPFIDGAQVGGETIVRPGQTLVFTRAAGEMGGPQS